MSHSNDPAFGQRTEQKLPQRDLLVLPLLSLLTMAICILTAELTFRHVFATSSGDSCRMDDDMIGYRFRPRCTARLKAAEAPWVTYEYNECGYRTRESCGPKPVGTTRIALLGSSLSAGLNVRYDETFATRTAHQLTQILGRPVEIQNLGRPNTSIIAAFHQVDEALALKPDLLMMAISPYDIEHLDPTELPDRYKPITSRQFSAADHARISSLAKIKALVNESHVVVAAEHFYYQDTSNFARMYLHYGDRADYLREPFSTAWEKRFAALDVILAEIKLKCDAASIPLVLMEVPTLAQASLLKMSDLPPGVNPYALNRRLAQVASRHGMQLIDTLDAFRQGPEPAQIFYVVDGHINAAGSALVAATLVRQLVERQRHALLTNNEPETRTKADKVE